MLVFLGFGYSESIIPGGDRIYNTPHGHINLSEIERLKGNREENTKLKRQLWDVQSTDQGKEIKRLRQVENDLRSKILSLEARLASSEDLGSESIPTILDQ